MSYGDGFPSEILGEDRDYLLSLLGDRPNMLILEVGSWLGRGTSRIFANHVAQHGGHLVCVDTWEGNPGVDHHDKFKETADPMVGFIANMKEWQLSKFVTMIRADSLTAHQFLANQTFDFVFIDANHQYSFVSQDIKNYMPKVKSGGIFSGHDCETRFESLSDEVRALVLEHPEDDYLRPHHVHPGVILALRDAGFPFKLAADSGSGSSIWSRTV